MILNIELPILFNNETTEELDLLEKKYKLSEHTIRDMFFIKIDSFAKYFDVNDSDKEYTEIFVSGNRFLCALTYSDLKKIVLTLN